MKITFKFILIVFIFTITSCSTTRNTYRNTNIENTNIITNDVVVDIKVDFDNVITTTSDKRKTIKQAKDEAYYKAITSNNVDIIVDPIFAVTTYSKNKHKAKLTGWGGKYTNPRSKTDVIKELEVVDTLDIKKYDVIFNGNSYSKTNNQILKSGNASTPKTVVAKKNSKNKSNKKTFNLKSGLGISFYRKANVLGDGAFENHGFSIGLHNYAKLNNKLGLRIGLEYSINEISNNLELPLTFNYKIFKRINVITGPRLTLNFDPKDKEFDQGFFGEDYYRDEIANTLNLGVDLGFRVDITKKIAVNWHTTVGVTDTDFALGGIGLSYQF